MICFVIPLCLVLISSVGLASAANVPAQNAPVRESTVIAIGVLQEVLSVIRPDKLSRTRTLPNGRREVVLPNPAEYMAGTLYRLRAENVIKGERKVRKGMIMNVFIAGSGSLHDPLLVKGQRFVLFLSPLKGDEDYKGTLVMTDNNSLVGSKQFNPIGSYILVSGRESAIPVTSANQKIISEVKAAVRNTR